MKENLVSKNPMRVCAGQNQTEGEVDMSSPLAVEEIQNGVEARPALPVAAPCIAGERDTRNAFPEHDQARPEPDAVSWPAVAGSPPTVDELLVRGGNFLQVYSKYADRFELPPQAHTFIALSLLAAILNKRGVIIEHGGETLTFDLWVLLVSTSGSGRDTALIPARKILRKAELDIIRKQDFGSRQAAQQQVARTPAGLYLWPEFSVVIKKFNDGLFSGLREWFTGCYDSLEIPPDITYRTHDNKPSADTPPILFTAAPRLNILATSARDWFTTNLKVEDTTVGFTPRWTIVQLPDSGRIIPKPQKANANMESWLAEFLRRAANMSGNRADLSEVENLYDQWYRHAKPRMKGPLEEPFFNRLRAQVLKFAVLFEVSRSLSLRVSPVAMGHALSLAICLEENLKQLVKTGSSREAGEISRMENFVKKADVEGCSLSEFVTEFRNMDARNRDAHLRTLVDGGSVVRFRRTGKGRPTTILVYKDFAEEYKRRHPEDTEI